MFDNNKILPVLLTSLLFLISINTYSNLPKGNKLDLPPIVIQQVPLDGNNISSFIVNSGIFDINIMIFNDPGFEWPKNSGSDAIFTAGLTTAAFVNNELLMSSALYAGEFAPGHIIISNGVPLAQTDSRFHIYKVKRGDNSGNSQDWLNWGLMVPYGAPFVDVNHNGTYEPAVDTPGVRNAEQTVFICLTDGFPENHHPSEGFGGGTAPMFNESHLTAWCYSAEYLQDVQFFKWDVINKNIYSWDKTYFTVGSDPDLGCGNDDYIGCDTIRNLGFCYNGEDVDCVSNHRYSGIVPAVGIQLLKCSNIQSRGLTSFVNFTNPSTPAPLCERDPNPGVMQAYNYMQGLKSDGTHWVIPPGGSSNITKYCYSGDPETGIGWTEGLPGNPHGRIVNCTSSDTGQYISVNQPGDRRMLLNSGSDNLTINPGDTQSFMIAQLVARGSGRLNSVTKLKQKADQVCMFVGSGYLIGLKNESIQVSHTFRVYPNYPNPFNPSTVINYQLPIRSVVNLTVYNALGEKVTVLVNEKQNSGTYKVVWDGSNYPSGIYFYQFRAGDYTTTNKMILLK